MWGAVQLEQVKVDAGPAIAADAVALRAMPSFDARDYISRRKSMSDVARNSFTVREI